MHCQQNPVFARNRICSDVRRLGMDYWDRQTCPCLCACLYNTAVKKEVKMWPGYMICYTDSVSRPVLNGQIPAGISLLPGTPASPGIQHRGSIRVPEDRAWTFLLYLFLAICQWSVVTGEPFIYNRNRLPSTPKLFRSESVCLFIISVFPLQRGNDANKVTFPSVWPGRVDYIPGLTVHRLYQEAGTDP